MANHADLGSATSQLIISFLPPSTRHRSLFYSTVIIGEANNYTRITSLTLYALVRMTIRTTCSIASFKARLVLSLFEDF